MVKFLFLIRFLPSWKNPLDFLSDKWNTFDTLLVISSFLPFGSYPLILRLLRIIRFTRVFRQISELKILITSILKSLKPMTFIAMILLIVIYIYAVLGTFAFSDNDPIHFGNLPVSMLSLLRAATFEDWTDLMYIQMYSCSDSEYGYNDHENLCTNPLKKPLTSIIYFISFIIISGLIILNLVIGVVIQSMTDAKHILVKEEELRQTIKNIDHIVKKIRSDKYQYLLEDNENIEKIH